MTNENTTIDFCATTDETTDEVLDDALPTGEKIDVETGEVIPELGTLASCLAFLANRMGPLPVVRPGEYPYHGKGAVKTRLASDSEFAIATFVAMWHLQTEYEQSTDSTKDKNRRGLMSSHAGSNGKHDYTNRIIAGAPLEAEEAEKVAKWGAMYSKQLAACLRQQAGPELAASSRVFFGG